MQSEVGELFRRTRFLLGWSLQEVARRLGYRNLNKGARRLESLEHGGSAADDFLQRAATALGIDLGEVAELRARDAAARRADFAAWLEVPQPMVLIGMAVGVTFGVKLPDGLTEKEAIAFAVDHQKTHPHRLCLVLDRKRSFWLPLGAAPYFTETTPDRPNFPYTTLG